MKIAILGGTNSREFAPFDDPDWQKWALGNQMAWYKDRLEVVDRIFEIHDDLCNRTEDYAHWLAGLGKPLVVGRGFPVKADHIEVFPFEEARELLDGDFLTSTPAYMMAYALLRYPVTDIGLWGVEMAVNDTEYFYEQPVMKEWIGFAKGKGIRIHLPEGCALGPPHYMEGVTGNKPEGIKPFTEADFRELVSLHEQKIAQAREQIAALQTRIAAHDGARQAYENMAKVARARWAGQTLEKLSDTVMIK